MTRSGPKIAIRADASTRIGSGHVMRCLTLAEDLRDAGADTTFVCRDLSGNLVQLIHSHQHQVAVLPAVRPPAGDETPDWQQDWNETQSALAPRAPFDWIIVDHYRLDRRWEGAARALAQRIMVIDDLADRPHDCDLLLDQNYYRNLEERYRDLVPQRCSLFLGPRYALLRKEFRGARLRPRETVGIARVLVFFGGADLTGETEKVIHALQNTEFSGIAADVVVGSSNPRIQEIRRLCESLPNVALHVQTDRMAKLMSDADLAIGAGGATTWERFRSELPAITVVTAPNQRETTLDLAEAGAIWYLGQAEELTPLDYEKALRDAIRQPGMLREIAHKAAEVMETTSARGGTDVRSRLVRAIVEVDSTVH
jgi:UDP-2,4-diacetamido-2,4,6-trideoxy-beta-L-altropyranose hydrolase